MKAGLLSMGLLAATLLTGGDVAAQSLEWYKTPRYRTQRKSWKSVKKRPNPRGTEDCRNAIDASVRAGGNITDSKPKEWDSRWS